MKKGLGIFLFLISCGGFAFAKKAEIKPTVNDFTVKALSAARDKQWEQVRELVLKGADVNGLDAQGDSLLSYALFYREPDMVQFLLEKGALANRVGGARISRMTLLNYAVETSKNTFAPRLEFNPENLKIAELLVSHGADQKIEVGDISPLEKAIAMGNTDMVALFTKNLPMFEKMNARLRARLNNVKARAMYRQNVRVLKHAD